MVIYKAFTVSKKNPGFDLMLDKIWSNIAYICIEILRSDVFFLHVYSQSASSNGKYFTCF